MPPRFVELPYALIVATAFDQKAKLVYSQDKDSNDLMKILKSVNCHRVQAWRL